MRRLLDLVCAKCGQVEQDVFVTNRITKHEVCGGKRDKIWLRAPGLHGLSAHYSHGLGRQVSSFTEEEKELTKKGMWIASRTETIRAYDYDPQGDVTVKAARKETIKKHVEKQAAKLAADGVIKMPS